MSSCNAYNHPPGCNCGWGGQWYTSGFRNYGGGLRNDTFRSTAAGEDFEFPFVTYPTYTIPNARCPLCPARVFFYQSPHGGRVFFDRLGPPWPKHSCTDKSAMRQHFSSAEGRSRFLTGATGQLSEPEPQVGGRSQAEPETAEIPAALIEPPPLAAWAEDGWMPFVIFRVVTHPIGIEAEGKLLETPESEAVRFHIVQDSADVRFYRIQGEQRFGFSLIHNTTPVLTALHESPIFLKRNPNGDGFLLSSFILTEDGEVEGIEVTVSGKVCNESSGLSSDPDKQTP